MKRRRPTPSYASLLRLAAAAACLLLAARTPPSARAYDGNDLGGSLSKEVDHAACVRLFSSQGSTGCRTPAHEGTTVPLYYLGGFSAANQQAFQRLPHPVGVVMPALLLNGTVLEYLAAHAPRVTAGVIVLDDEAPADAAAMDAGAYSPDVPTPQGQGTPSAALTVGPGHAWNAHGSGLALRAYDFPIVLATGASVPKVRAWAQHNGELGASAPYPRYKATFNFYFGPASKPGAEAAAGPAAPPLTSTDCLGWKDVEGSLAPQCLPMGGQSVWASFGGRQGLRGKPTVLLTAAMDGLALFHDRAPAANEAAASVLTLLAAAAAISNASAAGAVDLATLPSNLALALFQADEWGFAGSRRFVADIGSDFACEVPLAAAANNTSSSSSSIDGAGACLRPARPSLAFRDWSLENLAHVLAVDQVGVLAARDNEEEPLQLAAIYDGAAPTALVAGLAAAAETMDGAVVVDAYDGQGALPPTPLTTFARAAAGAAALSGAVLAGYGPGEGGQLQFLDPRYHSHRDNASHLLNATALASVATLTARAALLLAGADADAAAVVSAEPAFVEEMLACLTRDWNCPLMRPLRQAEMGNLKAGLGRPYLYTPPVPKVPSYYAGVLASYQGQPIVQRGDSLYGAWPQGQAAPTTTAAGDGNEDDIKVYAVPKPLEAFLRPWLAATLSAADPAAWRQQPQEAAPCQSSRDCGRGGETCDGGLARFECLAGACVCGSLAYYHLALDPGLAPLEEPDTFAVLSEATPNWAEPNWGTIGVRVYPDTSRAVESAAIGLGVGVAAASAVGAFLVQRALVKGHYFD